jgi:hypothetical protein
MLALRTGELKTMPDPIRLEWLVKVVNRGIIVPPEGGGGASCFRTAIEFAAPRRDTASHRGNSWQIR